MNIPKTNKGNVIDKLHGQSISDPYRWLEDVESTETQNWLDEQNVYTRSFLDSLPQRDELRKEFELLFREESIGAPSPRKGYYFFMKRKADQDLSVLYVKKGLDGEPRVLVDPNKISKEKGFPVNIGNYSVSKDASLITYGLSESANDKQNLHIMNVETGEDLGDVIPGDLYPSTGSWSLDNKGFWYTRRKESVPYGEEKFHKKIFYHVLGTSFKDDKLVFGEQFPKEEIPSVQTTADGKYVLVSIHISSEPTRRTELYFLDLGNPEKGFIPIVKSVKANVDAYFLGTIHRDFVYIKTNFNTPKWKIQRVAIADIEKGMDAWETVIPESEDRLIENFSVTGNKLFVLSLENVHSVLREYTLDGKYKKDIQFPGIGSSSCVTAELEGSEGFFEFTSFTYPPTIFRIDFLTDKISLLEQQKIGVDTSDIESEQVWYESKDGTKVPMFLIHKKGLQQNSDTPTVLYGYGGFNIKMLPSFMFSIIPFIQRGGLYAIANIRGGGEFGTAWHTAGTKKQKQNTFDDFIAAAEWLIAKSYTNSNQLAISGGSNGGLLVGAVMTQRPELVKAVVMSVPVVDMLRYHLFHGGRHWIPDWGSAEDKDMFSYLLEYSPYHNVKDRVKYPATFIATSDQDDRVHPGQAFKMAARLQEANVGENPIILRVERKAGHGGAVDVSRYIDKAVDQWSFIFSQLGI